MVSEIERPLVVKSNSGHQGNEKLLTKTWPGTRNNQVKSKIRKFVKDNFPAKISDLILPQARDKSGNLRSLHSSIGHIQEKRAKDHNRLIDKSGDFRNENKEIHELVNAKKTERNVVFKETSLQPLQVVAKIKEKSFNPVKEAKVNKKHIPALSADSKQNTIKDYLHPPSIDDDIISSSYSELEEENKDSTLHVTYTTSQDKFEKDNDFTPPNQNQKRKKTKEHTILTAGRRRTPDTRTEENRPPSVDDDPELEGSFEEDSADVPYGYIVSGLRRVKSEESRLFLDPDSYKPKKKRPKRKDSVEPMLDELPSNVFDPKKGKQKTKTDDKPTEIKPEEKEEDSSDPFSEETSTDDLLDPMPLHRLKEMEDKSFRIGKKDLISDHGVDILLPHPSRHISKHGGVIAPPVTVAKKYPKEDFCVHTKDKADKEKQKSKLSFFRHFNFCIHTTNPEDNDVYTLSTSSTSSKQKSSSLPEASGTTLHRGSSSFKSALSHQKSSSLPEPSRSTLHRRSSRFKSQGFSSVALIDNKEARRSKYSKIRQSSKNW